MIYGKTHNVYELELSPLEGQVNSLLTSWEQLKKENLFLRQKLSKLTQERAELLEKNQQAIVKIKRIITQLRNESSS